MKTTFLQFNLSTFQPFNYSVFILLILLPILGGGNYLFNLSPLWGSSVLFLMAAVSLLFSVLIRKKSDHLLSVLSLDGLFLAFILVATGSWFFSQNKPESFIALLALWGSVSLGLTVRLFLKDIHSIEKVMKIILFSSFAVILYEIYQSVWQFGGIVTEAAHDKSVKTLLKHLQWHRTPFSTFITSNTLACYLVMMVPLIVYFLVLERNSKNKMGWIGLFVAVSLALFLTGSKGGLITYVMLIGTGLMFLFKLDKNIFPRVFKQILIAVSVSIVLTLFLWRVEWKPSDQNTIKSEVAAFSITYDKVESSAQGRLHYWKTAFNIWKDHWVIGTGIGSYATISPQYQDNAFYSRHVHNDYLEMLAETGLGGFILFFCIIVVLFTQGIKMYQEVQNQTKSYQLGIEKSRLLLLTFSLFLSMAGFLLHSFIDFNWEVSANRTLFIVFLMLITALIGFVSEEESRLKGRTVSRVKIGSPVMIGLSLLVLVFQGIWIPKVTMAESYFALATDPPEKNLSKQIDLAQSAVEIFPSQFKYHLFLAGAYRQRGLMTRNLSDLDKAYQEAETALRLEPEVAETHSEFGTLLFLKGEKERVEKEWGLAIVKAKRNIHLYNQLGLFYLQEKKFQGAREILQNGLKNERGYLQANHPGLIDIVQGHLILAELYQEINQPDEGLQEYERVIALLQAYPDLNAAGYWNKLDPAYTSNVKAFSHFQSGKLYQSLGKTAQADIEFKLAKESGH